MNHIGLFEGIGGFSLAARWMGWNTVAWCEKNEACQKVLRYHFPEAEGHGDITTTDFKQYANRIDILTGGFPCQPFSLAGKRKGTEDDRHLWPEMLRAIREIKPRWVVGENVPGLVNWDGGLAFEQMLVDLENEGYEVQPYIIPACGVGAPHKRDRVWIVAHTGGINGSVSIQQRRQRTTCYAYAFRQGAERFVTNSENIGYKRRPSGDRWNAGELYTSKQNQHETNGGEFGGHSGVTTNANQFNRRPGAGRTYSPETCYHCEPVTADTNGIGFRRQSNGIGKPGFIGEDIAGDHWQNFPTQSPVCHRNDGLSFGLAGITFSKWRRQSLEQMGNAIVPHVAYEFYECIQQFEQ